MEGLGDAAYQSLDQATYTGARFDGIYNDANLTGSLMALAVLVGLYLIRTGRKPWERFAACFLTGLSAVAFFTAMSRGAILCFGATVLCYLLFVGKGQRGQLFLLLFFTALSMGAFGLLSMTLLSSGLGHWPRCHADLCSGACMKVWARRRQRFSMDTPA